MHGSALFDVALGEPPIVPSCFMPPSRFVWIPVIALFTGCPKKQPEQTDHPPVTQVHQELLRNASTRELHHQTAWKSSCWMQERALASRWLLLCPRGMDCVMRLSFESTMKLTAEGQSMVEDMEWPTLPTIGSCPRYASSPMTARITCATTTIFDVGMEAH